MPVLSKQPSIAWLTETALLSVLIALTGCIRLPGIIPGSDFQLSAPLAVAICAVFGCRQYLLAGILASILQVLMGGYSLFALGISFCFRLTVILFLAIASTGRLSVTLAGPAGSLLSRFLLAAFLQVPAFPLLWTALPGIVYIALSAWPLTVLLSKIYRLAPYRLS